MGKSEDKVPLCGIGHCVESVIAWNRSLLVTPASMGGEPAWVGGGGRPAGAWVVGKGEAGASSRHAHAMRMLQA